jgi:hypothetical protein
MSADTMIHVQHGIHVPAGELEVVVDSAYTVITHRNHMLLRHRHREVSTMHYAVLVCRTQSKAQDLADALTAQTTKPKKVYVVGMDDAQAFAKALVDGAIEIDDALTATEAMQYAYVEAIGTEDENNHVSHLIGFAQKRIAEIERRGTTRTPPIR